MKVFLGIAFAYIVEYLVTALFTWFLSLCFGFDFTWNIASGVFIIGLLVSIFSKHPSK